MILYHLLKDIIKLIALNERNSIDISTDFLNKYFRFCK